MKKFFMFLAIALTMLIAVPVFAQAAGDSEAPAVGLTTFVGIVALVSLAVTQVAKVWEFVYCHTIAKIGCSILIGIFTTLFSWWLNIADFLYGLTFWAVVFQGLLAGVSACGLYDLIKNLFKRE